MAKIPNQPSRGATADAYKEGGPGRHLKARLRAGGVVIGGIVAEYMRPSLIKLYRHAGFDFVYIENEHALFPPSAVTDTVLAARDNGLPAIAKVGQLERAETARLLEAGIVGIQLPRTESREQVETLRSFIKFPPRGTRAMAPGYGNSDYRQPAVLRDWMRDQDAETVLVVHIETRTGYENAESIIAAPGVDMCYVGPGDFSIEMGQPGNSEHPDVARPMAEILGICKRHKVAFGTTAANLADARKWIRKGARFFETLDELAFISEGATRLVRDYRAIADAPKPRGAGR